MIYQNRAEAGLVLASLLRKYINKKVVVIALPRGGVPVGVEVARAMKAKLDVLVVRKMGAPRNPEMAIGAIAPNGVWYLDKLAVKNLGITKEQTDEIAKKEVIELIRRQIKYRDDKPFPDIAGKTVVLVDDGIATGASIKAAIMAIRKKKPKKLVLAVPVAPKEIADELKMLTDEFVCPKIEENFSAVGAYYKNFEQVTDEEVGLMLKSSG